MMNKVFSYCDKCECMTNNIKKGSLLYVCDKCGYDKTLGSFFNYEIKKKEVNNE